MAGYDPKRARPATDAAADEPAPVDAILGDVPPAAPEAPAPPPAAPSPPAATPRPAFEVPPAPDGPSSRIVIIAGVAAATLAAIVLLRHRRRSP